MEQSLKKVDLSVDIAGIRMKNPVMTASGTFGYGEEYVPLNFLGALITKGTSLKPRLGNPPPRLVETTGGLLNAIGLQNIGVRELVEKKIPNFKRFGIPVIVNIFGTTLTGMAVDVETRTPKLGNITGGLSGPAIKPIALRMVWEVYNKVKIPIVGVGGICTPRDALEFIIAGASAVQIGTAHFIKPGVIIEVIEGLENYLKDHRIGAIRKLVGRLESSAGTLL